MMPPLRFIGSRIAVTPDADLASGYAFSSKDAGSRKTKAVSLDPKAVPKPLST
jgi:hypothetical protein